MKQKKIIERNLPLSVKYTLISIQRQNLETADCTLICANCNAEIINYATIHAETGKSYFVGLDCMETLTKSLTNLGTWQHQQLYFNSILRFYFLMRIAESVKIRDGIVYLTYRDKNGHLKEKSEFEHSFKDYGFDISKYVKPLTKREKLVESTLKDICGNYHAFTYTENGSKYEIQGSSDKIRLYRDGSLMRILTPGQVEKILERVIPE